MKPLFLNLSCPIPSQMDAFFIWYKILLTATHHSCVMSKSIPLLLPTSNSSILPLYLPPREVKREYGIIWGRKEEGDAHYGRMMRSSQQDFASYQKKICECDFSSPSLGAFTCMRVRSNHHQGPLDRRGFSDLCCLTR